MEKNKDVVKKPYTDAYESKKVSINKSNFFKNNPHISSRVEDSKSRLSNVSRTKHNQDHIAKKAAVYGNDTKPLYKRNCDECSIKRNSNLINAVSVDNSTSERKLEHCHNLNGNLFNVHPSLCNITCSVPEISHLNRVLKFQPTTRHNELSFSKCSKHKQRAIFPEQRGYNFKPTNSSNAFNSSKYSSSAANCNTQCHCSKSNSWNAGSIDPYFNLSPSESISEGTVTNDEYNLKCGLKCSPNPAITKDTENLTDLPILVHSNFSKASWEVKYCIDNKLRVSGKQRKWNSKPWGQAAVSSDRTRVDPKALDKTNKMLFPALPSNSHSQVKLNSSHTSSMPPSEHSSADNSDLESVNSFPDANITCTVPTFPTTVSSAIPQASYADVIRMSSTGVQSLLVSNFEKPPEEASSHNPSVNLLPDKLSKDENNQLGSSDWVISRLSQLDQNSSDIVHNVSVTLASQNEQNFGAPRPIVVSLEKPSFYNSSLQSNKNVLNAYASHANLISPDRKIVENDNLITDCLCGLDKISADKVSLLSDSMQAAALSDTVSDTNIPRTYLKTGSTYSSPSSIDSFSDTFKSAESSLLNACNYAKTQGPPVVIMNSSLSPQSMSEISFGIEYEEMVKLCADSCDTSVKSVSSFSLQDADECCFSEENTRSPDVDPESTKAHGKCENSCSAVSVASLMPEQFVTVKGKKIYWKDPADVDVKYNHQQMAEFFACVWKEFQDFANSAKGKGSIKYYNE